MNSFSDNHEPTPEFRAHIKREIARAIRSDHLSGAPAVPVRTRRFATMVGIAAGVVLTLAAGMVLGASASYASAAVLDEHQREANTNVLAATRRLIAGQLNLARTNYERVHAAFKKGTATGNALTIAAAQVDTLERTIAQIEIGLSASRASAAPTRSALAILPIKSALNALSCAPAPSIQQNAQTAPLPAAVAPSTQATATAHRADPDRARIIALANEHLPAVVRGDSAAEYVVMVLDAADKYLWSTHGSGNLSLVIGGDPRTGTERVAYMRQHSMEYTGAPGLDGIQLDVLKPLKYNRVGFDSLHDGAARLMTRRPGGDSIYLYRAYLESLTVRLRERQGSGAAGDGARGGGARGGARGGVGDSLVLDGRRFARLHGDSLVTQYMRGFEFARGDAGGARGGRGGGGLPNGVSPVNAPDGSYKIGWGGTRATASNAANGLEETGSGQSGVQGVLATSISMGESYVFAAGELAPQPVRIVVLHLAPGTAWRGR